MADGTVSKLARRDGRLDSSCLTETLHGPSELLPRDWLAGTRYSDEPGLDPSTASLLTPAHDLSPPLRQALDGCSIQTTRADQIDPMRGQFNQRINGHITRINQVLTR